MVKPRTRIILALLFGSCLIASAFWFKVNQSTAINSLTDTFESVAPGETRAYIKPTDIDDDGVPDWLTPLLGDEIVISSSTEPYVPDTFTGQVAVSIYDAYINANENTRPADMAALIASEIKVSQQLLLDAQVTTNQIRTTDNSPTQLKNYGNQIALLILNAQADGVTETETVLLNRVLQTESPQATEKLTTLSQLYKNTYEQLLSITVPSDLAAEHVALINILYAQHQNLKAFASVLEDPITALVRLERHPYDQRALYTTITNLYQKLYDAGIQWGSDEPTRQLIDFVE